MISGGRLTLFSIAASISYTFAYYFDLPLFRYYPAVNELHVVKQTQFSGFSILWYGWVATAVLVGVIVAVAVPKRWIERIPPDLSWLVSIVLIVAVLVYEKRWFFV